MARTLLVVDDDPMVVRMVQMAFELEGYTVLSAGDGEAGLARAREGRPDVILLDVMMPKMDGLAITRALKGDATTATIPIVLVSAKTAEKDVQQGRAAGADAYVAKPFQMKALSQKVADLLGPA